MLNKCRNDVFKYGDNNRKIEGVMACFGRGGGKSTPCSLHTVLQAAAYRVNKDVLSAELEINDAFTLFIAIPSVVICEIMFDVRK